MNRSDKLVNRIQPDWKITQSYYSPFENGYPGMADLT